MQKRTKNEEEEEEEDNINMFPKVEAILDRKTTHFFI